MKKLTLVIITLMFLISGCGGLRHIKLGEQSDTEWKTKSTEPQENEALE